MYKNFRKIIDLPLSLENLPLSLFNSQGYFWLTSAISFAFAAEELEQLIRKIDRFKELEVLPWRSKPLIDIFKDSLKRGEVTPEAQEISQQAALHNLTIINQFVNKHCNFFNLENGLVVGKAFFAHWLIYKIIELEWQEVLDLKMLQENYFILDAFLEDYQELEKVEEKYFLESSLSLDERLYLRGHWERATVFWSKTYQDLELLRGGWIPFQSAYIVAER